MKKFRTYAFLAALLALSAVPTFAADTNTTAAETRPLFERLWWAQGHTHPIVVHIPIGLLMAGALAAILRIVFRKSINIGIVYFCLFIGTGGAIISTLAGWAWAPQKDSAYVDAFVKSDISLHRWGGLAVTGLCVIVLGWATIALRRRAAFQATIHDTQPGTPVSDKLVIQESLVPPSQFGWQAAVVILAAATGWVGHEGGELVYPKNFETVMQIASGETAPPLKVAKPKKTEPIIASNPPSTNPATTTPGSTTQPVIPGMVIPTPHATSKVDFAKEVAPILVAKCIYCHGPDKSKGKLQMHTEELSLKGGENGPLYKKGDPAGSDLIKRIITQEADELMPPPKEKKPVTPEELAILKQWITEGAQWNVQWVLDK